MRHLASTLMLIIANNSGASVVDAQITGKGWPSVQALGCKFTDKPSQLEENSRNCPASTGSTASTASTATSTTTPTPASSTKIASAPVRVARDGTLVFHRIPPSGFPARLSSPAAALPIVEAVIGRYVPPYARNRSPS